MHVTRKIPKSQSEPQIQAQFTWCITFSRPITIPGNKTRGFAITTRMHMLGRCLRRLNARVAELRQKLSSDIPQLDACLSKGYAFTFPNKELSYELLLD